MFFRVVVQPVFGDEMDIVFNSENIDSIECVTLEKKIKVRTRSGLFSIELENDKQLEDLYKGFMEMLNPDSIGEYSTEISEFYQL